ncbi:hypothetical protein CHRY9390_01713 [Chryseobacterium aquaeductus]|uniref:Teichoic acid transporter n=1 Tax=Chryseobacterium aquaeductus TaxID=2675056 RepID=A0A9N8QUL9_9FLAO|nr:polysaccharide biosynthesis C-terminal domain-containing protein [Chryseobacterium aquaeductus]CAA7331033.1 hypothetical protein CHRY9390_01713 [Chryseobacterium potabilaquae]CAD7807775.1 hypothetical protein CHRY9390_01713 [Chryseobacterium aquaeductus]
MNQLSVVQTFISRFFILLLSFALVIFSTNMWGSEGKGVISIVVANSAIIGFFSNIFAGSSISYFTSKYQTEKVLLYAYLWSVIIGIVGPVISCALFFESKYLVYLIGISVLFSLLSANINLFIGKRDIKKYNLYTILQQLIHILFIIVLIYFLNEKSVEVYFIAQICCYGFLFLLSSYGILKHLNLNQISFSKEIIFSIFTYGWKSQLSAFIQFLNYRLSFYFLEYYIGISYVGIFSIGVVFSEAIWTVSRSLAVVLYSDLLNNTNTEDIISKTKISLKITFLVTLFFIIGIIFVPNQFYIFIFGKDFYQTKDIILLLSPGILAIAVSNIIGFYFAGKNKLGILNLKSIFGLAITISFSIYAVPRWGILGACVVTTLSYCASSSLLFWKFYQLTKFRMSDYFISKTEINTVLNKFLKK